MRINCTYPHRIYIRPMEHLNKLNETIRLTIIIEAGVKLIYSYLCFISKLQSKV